MHSISFFISAIGVSTIVGKGVEKVLEKGLAVRRANKQMAQIVISYSHLLKAKKICHNRHKSVYHGSVYLSSVIAFPWGSLGQFPLCEQL